MKPLKTFETVAMGSRAEHTRVVHEEDVLAYADSTGDYNPVHVDEEYARETRFGARVAHGLLTCGLVQKSLTELVAPGGVSLSYEFRLLRPVFMGDTITATAEVIEKRPDRNLVVCALSCANQRGEMVVEGRADIKMLKNPEGD
jgi:acyl dehydratase